MKLKALIEETYTMNNKTSVTLIVHSMGGLMAIHFLRLQPQSWKDQHIRRMISISTPWAGSMKAVKVFAIGEYLLIINTRIGIFQYKLLINLLDAKLNGSSDAKVKFYCKIWHQNVMVLERHVV